MQHVFVCLVQCAALAAWHRPSAHLAPLPALQVNYVGKAGNLYTDAGAGSCTRRRAASGIRSAPWLKL